MKLLRVLNMQRRRKIHALSGESDKKFILDAFYLGNAVVEGLDERVGSTIGGFFSVIGQWQSQQPKQAQAFQDEVLERAIEAKENVKPWKDRDQSMNSENVAAHFSSL